jgi:DNA mismatch endonuclease (patch repair protein)
MSRHPRRDTGPELALRRLLHAAGYRYRVNYAVPGLPRRSIDVAFTRAKVAVFIDGCFWHGCPDHGQVPTANNAWWIAKLDRNRERDVGTAAHLTALGWTVLRLWEHTEPSHALDEVTAVLGSRDDAAGTAGRSQILRTSSRSSS